MSRRVVAVDLFCGAGGTSTGLALACEALGLQIDLLAINHWETAISTHAMNHPWARHLCKSLHEVDPRQAVPDRRLNLLVAAPECVHHSKARGGRPVSDQMRMSAWQVVDWLSALHVDRVLIENVREFRDWGPVDRQGRVIKSRRGEIYRAFLGAIRSLGYRVEDRVLNAANYGDPTTRERLFILARRGSRRLQWPEPTHAPQPTLDGKTLWRPAREIIDWSIPGESIWTRTRPLSVNTLARIAAGLRKFSGLSFVVGPGSGDPLPRLEGSLMAGEGWLKALNKLAKWRAVYAGWQLGTRPDHDPECQAVRDQVEKLLVLRAEVTALTTLLIEKGLVTREEFLVVLEAEARELDRMLEERFPGISTSEMGVHYTLPEAARTMAGWRP